MHRVTFDQWYPMARRIAGARAAAVAVQHRLPAEDRRDLVQEALREFLEKGDAYDQRLGSFPTFAEHVIRNGLATLIRYQNARCRRRAVEVDIDAVKDDCLRRLHASTCRMRRPSAFLPALAI